MAREYLVLEPDGREWDPAEDCEKEGAFGRLIEEEVLEGPSVEKGEPAYLKVCHKFGIEWERMSDVGHARYGPRGALMFDLAGDYASEVVHDLGLPVVTVKGTNMFDMEQPAVAQHAGLFGDRLYAVGESCILRYAACHQQFAIARDWQISHRQIPFGAFELADAYRLEQSGECMLCFRTRRLTMPDLHVFCRDVAKAQEWFARLHERVYAEIETLGLDYEMLVNCASEEVYRASRPWLLELLRAKGKPALLRFYPPGADYYWTVNVEYCIVDVGDRAREIGTIQIDVGNAERFGIRYVDEQGRDRRPVIIHTAVIGTLERYLYSVFDRAVSLEEETGVGAIPLWLNPEQVLLLPVAERHVEAADRLAERLERARVRVGVDDRNETVGRKIRDAGRDWVRYTVVVGDREAGGGELEIQDREMGRNGLHTVEALIERIGTEVAGKPVRRMYAPRHVSRRPVEQPA